MPTYLATTLLAIALALSGSFPPGADDAKDLRDKDPLVRLAAVERTAAGEDHVAAEQLLLKALSDDDWEVVLRAAEGLGRVGGKKAVAPLTSLAWDGPVRCVRRAAAQSLAGIDAEAGRKGIAKKLGGDTAPRAADAYGLVSRGAEGGRPAAGLAKLLKSKETLPRAAAARALVLATKEGRAERLGELLHSDYAAVVAAALEAAAMDPRPEQREPLVAFLQRPRLLDVHERRARRALVRTVGSLGGEAANAALFAAVAALGAAAEVGAAARGARLVETAADEAWFDPGPLLESTAPARAHASPDVRAAAARALRFAGKEHGLEPARTLAASDAAPRVRRAALATSLALVGLADDEQRAWVIALLAAEKDEDVREDLVVSLAVRDHPDAAAALVAALEDSSWGVVVCAAVSLGRTRDESAVARLVPLLQDHNDWRKRGAAVVGLYHAMDKAAVPHLIAALADPEPLVRRTAHAFLGAVNRGRPLPPDPKVWTAWWGENEKRVVMDDPKERAARNERFGLSAAPKDVYAGLDVLVFESRGDHIENILQHLGIEFRVTSGGRIPEDGLDANGVCVVNCTGEMDAHDVERLQWFVRVGGYLFGSCWAVHETIERVAPGAVRRFETLGDVMDRVTATPGATGSPYLEGVFERDVVPIYHLEGAHLIEVLEPERVEVLVDSAECAERWGNGNLACWFSFGHGKILDSANHFDLQGLAQALGLKKPEDRKAFALDHLGTDFATLRATRHEKFWGSNQKASEHIRDLSVFTLITNFVRLRRIQGY